MNSSFYKHFFLFILLLIPHFKLFSVELNFKYYKVEDGLTSNTIYTVLQDSKGFMWFGTEYGINRFDGYTFTSFENIPGDENSLINNSVYSIVEDDTQRLWIGTEKGVSILELNKNIIKRFTPQTSNGCIINDRVENIILDINKIWISSSKQGVFLFQDNILTLFSFKEFQEKANSSIWVTNIYRDLDGTLWASVNNTHHQIYIFDKEAEKFIPAFPELSKSELNTLSSYSMLETANGTLWFGTWTNGLIKINKNDRIIKGRFLSRTGIDKITTYITLQNITTQYS